MYNDKSAIEILTEFAKNTGRKIEFLEQPYPKGFIRPVAYHKRKLYIPGNKEETSYFICYQDSTEFGEHAMYSGVFVPISVPESFRIKVRKKDVIDKLNVFSRKKSIKTENQDFDSQVVLTVSDPDKAKLILKNKNIQGIIIKAFKLNEEFKIAINEVDISFVPPFKNKSYFGIYSTQQWILERETIETLFWLIEKFRSLIQS